MEVYMRIPPNSADILQASSHDMIDKCQLSEWYLLSTDDDLLSTDWCFMSGPKQGVDRATSIMHSKINAYLTWFGNVGNNYDGNYGGNYYSG